MATLQVFSDGGEGELEKVEDVYRRLREAETSSQWIELSRPHRAWPMLSVMVNRGWCVLHLTTEEEGQLLTLEGGSCTDAPEQLDFMFAGTPTTFTREYLNSLTMAEEVIDAFASGAQWPASVKWHEI